MIYLSPEQCSEIKEVQLKIDGNYVKMRTEEAFDKLNTRIGDKLALIDSVSNPPIVQIIDGHSVQKIKKSKRRIKAPIEAVSKHKKSNLPISMEGKKLPNLSVAVDFHTKKSRKKPRIQSGTRFKPDTVVPETLLRKFQVILIRRKIQLGALEELAYLPNLKYIYAYNSTVSFEFIQRISKYNSNEIRFETEPYSGGNAPEKGSDMVENVKAVLTPDSIFSLEDSLTEQTIILDLDFQNNAYMHAGSKSQNVENIIPKNIETFILNVRDPGDYKEVSIPCVKSSLRIVLESEKCTFEFTNPIAKYGTKFDLNAFSLSNDSDVLRIQNSLPFDLVSISTRCDDPPHLGSKLVGLYGAEHPSVSQLELFGELDSVILKSYADVFRGVKKLHLYQFTSLLGKNIKDFFPEVAFFIGENLPEWDKEFPAEVLETINIWKQQGVEVVFNRHETGHFEISDYTLE